MAKLGKKWNVLLSSNDKQNINVFLRDQFHWYIECYILKMFSKCSEHVTWCLYEKEGFIPLSWGDIQMIPELGLKKVGICFVWKVKKWILFRQTVGVKPWRLINMQCLGPCVTGNNLTPPPFSRPLIFYMSSPFLIDQIEVKATWWGSFPNRISRGQPSVIQSKAGGSPGMAWAKMILEIDRKR